MIKNATAPNLSRRELLGACGAASVCALMGRQALAVQPPVTDPPDPEETKLRAFLNGKIVFDRFLFSGDTFPVCRLEPAQAAEAWLGQYELKPTFYDARGKAVTRAQEPGPYAAVIELTSTQGHATRRLMTLYRLAEAVPNAGTISVGNLPDLAYIARISPTLLTRQTELIVATCKDRDWQSLSHDPRVARLFAGLYVGLPEEKSEGESREDGRRKTEDGNHPLSTIHYPLTTSTPRKNLDAFAAERQWWVKLKRKLSGADKRYAHARFGPDVTRGVLAPVVRAGTLREAGFKPDTTEKIDAALQAWAGDTDQAFAACVVRHGVIAFHKAYGTRDGQPMTTETKSWMASITKPMCATLMMMLVDRGVVGLDDPIEKYLPSLRGIKVETPITIRHLYTHTSGLDKWPGWSDELPDVEDQLADCYPFVRVGKVWSYGGQGNTTGAKIIETISGESLPLAYLHHLHGPLGNTHTDVIGAHADAFSVPLDIARFGQMLLNRGAYGNLRFMRPETFASMLPQKLTRTLGPDATKTFGIGLDGSPTSFGHGAASAATFHIETDRDLVVIMTRNSIGTNYDKYNGKFWQAINDSIIA